MVRGNTTSDVLTAMDHDPWSLVERLRRDSEAAIGAGNLTIPDAHRLLTHKASTPCIPSTPNRNKRLPSSKRLYKMRHTVENLFAKLKDRRPSATRYHRYARIFLSAVPLGATLISWL
ncbi:MAG: hypothetical protein F4074_07635 [Synechococcus sp. SB0672_bin_10]|nr:hypothetical protein [Synechococcus sp. SB0672_bin_10]